MKAISGISHIQTHMHTALRKHTHSRKGRFLRRGTARHTHRETGTAGKQHARYESSRMIYVVKVRYNTVVILRQTTAVTATARATTKLSFGVRVRSAFT